MLQLKFYYFFSTDVFNTV